MAKPTSKKAQIERLEARMNVATGRGTETYRASLQAQIEALQGKAVGEQGPEKVELPAGSEVKKAPS